LKSLPLGSTYAVWTGIGTVRTAIEGVPLFGYSIDWVRIAWIALIVIGIVGLESGKVSMRMQRLNLSIRHS
jgi:quaternary ammonium compound-resistance protein SugE